jgi:hypothetical protein
MFRLQGGRGPFKMADSRLLMLEDAGGHIITGTYSPDSLQEVRNKAV